MQLWSQISAVLAVLRDTSAPLQLASLLPHSQPPFGGVHVRLAQVGLDLGSPHQVGSRKFDIARLLRPSSSKCCSV